MLQTEASHSRTLHADLYRLRRTIFFRLNSEPALRDHFEPRSSRPLGPSDRATQEKCGDLSNIRPEYLCHGRDDAVGGCSALFFWTPCGRDQEQTVDDESHALDDTSLTRSDQSLRISVRRSAKIVI